VNHEFLCPFALDCLCNCCGLISRIGQSSTYITLFINNIVLSLFSWSILSCTVPLPSAVMPPATPFKVVYWCWLMYEIVNIWCYAARCSGVNDSM
jgi:hypothetical protein